jgi:menaquinone-specific isochorismate synthase
MNKATKFKEIVNELTDKIRFNSNKSTEQGKIIRFETEIPELDLLKWLSDQNEYPKFFFAGRDERDETVAGLGAIKTVELSNGDYNGAINKILKESDSNDLKFYGGISFPTNNLDREWKTFGKMKFLIPEFEIIKRGKKTVLACNIDKDNYSPHSFEKRLRDIFTEKNSFYEIFIEPLSVSSVPEFEEWKKTVRNITFEIKDGTYEKLVLARKRIYEFKERVNPFLLLSILKQGLSERYFFLFQFEKNSSFLGLSMERLYKRINHEIKTEAIAGTIDRGNDSINDRGKIEDLLLSDKDNKEQKYVEDFIKKKLVILCDGFDKSEKRILKLKESFHLVSEFKGMLKEGVSDTEIINELHPTPAVGGSPEKDIERHIYKNEGFSRGWYAGLVGYLSKRQTDFSVALRSALIYNNKLSLYTGVGLIEDSEPVKEWREGSWKMKNFEDIFKI